MPCFHSIILVLFAASAIPATAGIPPLLPPQADWVSRSYYTAELNEEQLHRSVDIWQNQKCKKNGGTVVYTRWYLQIINSALHELTFLGIVARAVSKSDTERRCKFSHCLFYKLRFSDVRSLNFSQVTVFNVGKRVSQSDFEKFLKRNKIGYQSAKKPVPIAHATLSFEVGERREYCHPGIVFLHAPPEQKCTAGQHRKFLFGVTALLSSDRIPHRKINLAGSSVAANLSPYGRFTLEVQTFVLFSFLFFRDEVG